jgi:hypothetical protein
MRYKCRPALNTWYTREYGLTINKWILIKKEYLVSVVYLQWLLYNCINSWISFPIADHTVPINTKTIKLSMHRWLNTKIIKISMFSLLNTNIIRWTRDIHVNMVWPLTNGYLSKRNIWFLWFICNDIFETEIIFVFNQLYIAITFQNWIKENIYHAEQLTTMDWFLTQVKL